MALTHVNIATLSGADIDALVANGVSEGRELDFKRDYSLAKDGEKKEFSCDIAAMANTLGGDIIYGIEESDGRAAVITGVTIPSEDGERQRIESVLTNAVSPRLAVHVRLIQCGNGKSVLVVRVPQSMSAPHMVVYNNDHRFYGRNASQRFLMDVRQVRETFMATEQLTNRIREFRRSRLDWIIHNEVGSRLLSPQMIVLHLIPVSAMRDGQRFSVHQLRASESLDIRALYQEFELTSYVNLFQLAFKMSVKMIYRRHVQTMPDRSHCDKTRARRGGTCARH